MLRNKRSYESNRKVQIYFKTGRMEFLIFRQSRKDSLSILKSFWSSCIVLIFPLGFIISATKLTFFLYKCGKNIKLVVSYNNSVPRMSEKPLITLFLEISDHALKTSLQKSFLIFNIILPHHTEPSVDNLYPIFGTVIFSNFSHFAFSTNQILLIKVDFRDVMKYR